MTAFSKLDLPDWVDSVEKVHLWSGLVLQANYADKNEEESRGNPVRNVAITPFFNDSSEYPEEWHWQTIIRTSLRLDSAWLQGGQLAQFAQSLGDLSIPAAFKPPVQNP